MRVNFLLSRSGEPDITTAEIPCKGIQEDFFWVKEMALGRIPRTLHPVTVLQLFVVEIVDDHRENIANLAFRRERNLRIGLRFAPAEKNQRTGRCVSRVNREVHSTGHMTCPVGKRMPVSQTEALILVGVMERGAHGGKSKPTERNMELRNSRERLVRIPDHHLKFPKFQITPPDPQEE